MPPVRVLVTGGGGFVGGEIVDALVAKHPDWQVAVVDVKRPAAPAKAVEFCTADVRDAQAMLDVLERTRPQIVVHSAGVVPKGNARYNERAKDAVAALNVQGTQNMLQASQKLGVEGFVFTSSSQVIADDHDHDYPNFDETVPFPERSLVYGASKARAEKMVLEANRPGFSTCAIRPSVILGREDYQLVPGIHGCIEKNETQFQIGDGDNLYDFTFVGNVADAHVLAVENLLGPKTAAGEAILISNGQPITFRDFCLAVWAAFDHVPPRTIKIPVSLAWTIALVIEIFTWLTGLPQTLSRGSIKDATGTRYCDLSKARELLGYEARVDLWDGITISCEAYKQRLLSHKQRA